MLLWWGPDFIQLYNDAYIPVLGSKHPHQSLGKPFRECWSEVYHVLGPLAEKPFHGGPPTWIEDIPVELNRHGYQEEAHFTISYSPVPDATVPNGIGGVLAIVHEISTKIVADRRILALSDLGARTADPERAEDACNAAARILAPYSKDIPFCLIYLMEENGESAWLAGKIGTEDCLALCPEQIDLRHESQGWPLARCMRSENIVVVDDLPQRFDRIPDGPWADPPSMAAVVPIKSNFAHQLAGFFVAGISSRLKFDDSYRVFLELASAQIATAIASARAIEAERRRNEALAEIDRAKIAFFSNISHEFRTPLTLLLGPLDDILAKTEGQTEADRERLELAQRNALRLLKLVNSLLDFSRIEAGRVQVSFEAVNLSEFTADLASMFRSIIERAKIRLIIDCEPLSVPVYVDREMWEAIVFNLLSNAFKFTFQGEIRVTLRVVDDHAEMVVSDTGTGIPSEEIPQLFNRFHRVRGARGRSYEGSGIGLALVQELVRLHGGTIRVESEPDRGSSFVVSIPLEASHLSAGNMKLQHSSISTGFSAKTYIQEAERWVIDYDKLAVSGPSVAVVKDLKTAANQELILIADDNADMRTYISRMLEPHYRIEAVSDGAQAIEAINRLKPALALLDVMMPVLDGFAAVRAIRSNPDVNSTPIILLSARAGEESRVEGLQKGADDYMVKPFSARELLVRVESHLALARLRRQSENEIRQSEERFRAFVAASSDVVYQMSPDWKVMRHLEGRQFISSTESPDQSWLERYIHPNDQPGVLAAVEHAIVTKSSFELEHKVLRTDGSIGWTFSRAVPLMDEAGTIKEWFGMATDITTRKLAEEALLRSERLSSLGRMAATISHEINNPLEALTNLLFLAGMTEGLPQTARDRLDEAEAELQRIAHIARQALGFYRESTVPSAINVNSLLESTIDLLKAKIAAKKIVIKKEWKATCEINGVAGELRQVFSNLLANCVDAVSDEGVIAMRISNCILRSGKPGVRVTFADNGKGIEAAALHRIFEPLYTTKGDVGTGLGLWVSKQIIEKHKGLIQMRSATTGPRKGSTFSIVFPK
ncbi:ATP-binding protein [Acidicapsa dinghuensis]|uniref:histidine kinase n=2 Tax=Acidicapsa dinghuensis TaxID=2218256 RepID=A0ABW1ED92_9BACT